MSGRFSTLKTMLLYGAAFSGIAYAGGALAQTQTAASNSSSGVTSDVQEVIVTANKRDERLHDVAMGITAISGADLQTRQELDFRDFAAQVPGFNVQSYGVGGENREILRGQNSGGLGATVATVIDEMPFSFSGSDNDAGLNSTNPDTYDLKRVEVLKGPQGTLYGATAEGGVVKFVTNPPDTTAFHVGAEVGGDTVAHGGDGGDAKGYLNVPFWNGKAALRLTGFYEDMPGYVDNPYLNERDVNRTDRYGGRASLLVKPTTDLSVRLTVGLQDVRASGWGLMEVNGTALAPSTSSNRFNLADGYTFNSYYDQPDKQITNYSIADIEYDLHWARFASITSFGTLKNSYMRDVTPFQISAGLDYGQYLGEIFFGRPEGYLEHQVESLNKSNQEFRISSEPDAMLFGHKIDWIGGVYLTRENVNFSQLTDFTTIPTASTAGMILTSSPGGGARFPSRYEEGALFGQVDYHLTSRIDVAIGARTGYDTEQEQTITFCCVLDGPSVTNPVYKHNERPTTWSVSPRWQITDDTLAYVRFSTGYRPGGPSIVPPNAAATYHAFYNSDSTMNYELGLRSELLRHLLTIDLAAFYIDWSDIQVTSPFKGANGVSYYTVGNAGTATSEGLEYNFSLHPIRGLTLALIGSYTDARLTQDAPGLGAFAGQQLPYVPKWTNTVNADYQWQVAEGYNAFVGGTLVFEGSRFTDFSPTILNDPHARLPSYETLALHGGVKKGPYTFEAYANNVTDSRGISYYNGQNAYGSTGYVNLITPLTVGIRASVDY